MRIAVIGAGTIGRTLGASGQPPATRSSTASVPRGARDRADRRCRRRRGGRPARRPGPGGEGGARRARLGARRQGRDRRDQRLQGAGKLHALDELADGAHPVRAFNTLGWENFADPVFDGVTADLFYAAEEGHGKEVADRLIAEIGLRPVWLGGVEAFDLVDSLTRLWFTLALQRKLGRRLAFKMLVGH